MSPTLIVLFHLRSNVGIAHAAQVIARVSEILISFHATPSFWTLQRSRSDKHAMIVYKITPYDNGHADLVRIIPDLRFEVKVFPSRPHLLYFPLLRSNVGIAHAAQDIARVREILTSSHAPHYVEHLNAVARIKVQWSCTRSPVMILAMLILWGSS